MKVWKCKACGHTEFIEKIIGGLQNSTFDESGSCTDYIDQELDFGDVYCGNCDSTGACIQDIANYEEEED